MLPVLVKLGPLAVYSFGFFLALGVISGLFVVWKQASDRGLPEEKIIDIFLLTVTVMVFAGRLGYVLSHWSFFATDFGKVFFFLKYPGFSFTSALTAAAVAIIPLALLNGLEVYLVWDLLTIGLGVSTIFFQIGCFLNGCASGTPWVPLGLGLTSVILTGGFYLIARRLTSSVSFRELAKKPGIFFLCYLIFYPLSFLMLTYRGNPQATNYYYSGVVGLGLVFFIIRYHQIFSMVSIKFPSSVLSQIKAYLEQRRRETEKRLAELKKEDPFEDKTRLLDRASDDSEAQSKAGHEQVAALSRQLNMALIQTRKALTKIKLGKYGICENCGKMIDTDRLAAMPTATLCVNCMKKRER